MKKTAFLMAGVAVLALSATAASAQSINTFSTGQQTRVIAGTVAGNNISIEGLTRNIPFGGSFLPPALPISNTSNIATANDSTATNSAWHATGISVGNVGGAGERFDNATFSLQGTVSTDCAFYTGTSNSLSFDFGQIGIYVSDNTGPAAAFTMVAPAAMNFDTNLAGCNTANTVSISKNDIRGMVNTTGGGYDTDVFQANLPYIVTASYTAPSTNTVTGGSPQQLTVGAAANAAQSAQHGAWKSNMDIEVSIPQADLALLAGSYSGNFTVTVAAL